MKYSNYKQLQDKLPQLTGKLIKWTVSRENKWGFLTADALNEGYKKAEEEVQRYLDDIVFSPNNFLEQYDGMLKWHSVLGEKEKQAVGRILPYDFSEPLKLEWNSYHRFKRNLLKGIDYFGTCESNFSPNFMDSWYDGSYTIINEEKVDEVAGGLVTINNYGAHCLNVDRMMIIDIDTYYNNALDHSCDIAQVAVYPEQAIASLKVIQEKQGGSYRVYDTAGGLRVIETTKEWNPTDYHSSLKLMKSIHADPLYVNLCRYQETFRARLTPKPWRWDESDYSEDETWGVCHLREIIGDPEKIDAKFAEVIDYHDKRTNAYDHDSHLV